MTDGELTQGMSAAAAMNVEEGRTDSGTASVDTSDVVLGLAHPHAYRRQPLPGDRWRLLAFIFMHLMSLSCELVFLGIVASKRMWILAVPMIITLVLTGAFCAHAAWHVRLAGGSRCLPLKDKPWWLGWFLAVPYGWLQMIVVAMSWEEFQARSPSLSLRQEGSGGERITTNRFHLKAVNGIMEGVIFSTAITYTSWSMAIPEDNPFVEEGTWMSYFIQVAGCIAFITAGLGVLELDFCVSDLVARQMRKSIWLELKHIVFRTSEVWSRVALLTFWCVTTQPEIGKLSFFILPVDALLTLIPIVMYSGHETSWLIRILLGVPCSFANLFHFIDSPYKRRAARKLSFALTVRNFLELLFLPIGAWLVNRNVWTAWKDICVVHVKSTVLSLLATPLYIVFLILMYIHSKRIPKDVFSACEEGDYDAVLNLTRRAAVAIDLDCRDVFGQTPLMIAAMGGSHDICRLLLAERASVEVLSLGVSRCSLAILGSRSGVRWTALHFAAKRGGGDVVRVLLEASSSNSNAYRDGAGDTPLHVAARFGSSEVIRVMVSRRPEWSHMHNDRGYTPAECAQSQEAAEVFRTICPPTPPRSYIEPLMASSSGPDTVGHSSSAWPQVSLQISRSISRDARQRVSCEAPGLCSFVASCSGGVLGRYFLIDAMPSQPLRVIDEGSTFVEDSVIVGDDTGDEEQDEHEAEVQAMHAPPAFENLEPIDLEGNVIPLFQEFLERARRQSNMTLGHCFLNPPLEAELGQGSYGIVWRARDRVESQWFAVKNIRVRGSNMAALALRDAEAANMVRVNPHPCLVQLFHIQHFPTVQLFCLVMEFCPGGDLQGRVRTAKRQALSAGETYSPPERAIAWLGQVFLGLEHLHLTVGALLRDLKPDNVVLSADGHAKIIDFGFCRLSPESDGTWTFDVPPGSPGYVAPEVIRGDRYTFPADLYSYGVVAWLLLSGGLTGTHTDGLPEPLPPFGLMKHRRDYSSLYQDWRRLRHCINNPARAGTRPLSEQEANFVSQLVQHRPEARLNHERVRRHPLMRSLGLPPAGAHQLSVEAWLRRGSMERSARTPTSSPVRRRMSSSASDPRPEVDGCVSGQA